MMGAPTQSDSRWVGICLAAGVFAATMHLAGRCEDLAAPPEALREAAPARDRSPTRFIRISRDANARPVALETAITSYVPASGEGDLVVDLIAAVHIADREYYQRLNRQFGQYDALLYELVAPEGSRLPRKERRAHSVLSLPMEIAGSFLQLTSQTHHIDYTRPNFVHADLSPEQMAQAIRDRGDDGLTLFLGITADLLREHNLRLRRTREERESARSLPELDPFSLLLDPTGPVKLRRILAEQLVEQAGSSLGLGRTLETILIEDRNKAALQVFQKELAKGKERIAIFYGAGHMPDFERRLLATFGLKRQESRWLTAWELRATGENLAQRLLRELLEK